MIPSVGAGVDTPCTLKLRQDLAGDLQQPSYSTDADAGGNQMRIVADGFQLSNLASLLGHRKGPATGCSARSG